MPSTSMPGLSASQIASSSRCGGSGRSMRQPWIRSSSLICRIAASSVSCPQSAGSALRMLRMPIFSQRFTALCS